MTLLKAPLLHLRGFFCSFVAFFLVVLSAFLVLNQIQNQPSLTDHNQTIKNFQNPPVPRLTPYQETQVKNQHPAPLPNQKENPPPLPKNIEINETPEFVVSKHDEDDKSECDWSKGQWVFDNVTRPLYHMDQCKFMHEEVACDKYGRKDVRYQQWRWQPNSCDLPRFDGVKFLEKIRGKRLVFVGDSVNRNQWASMACLIEAAVPQEQNKQRIYSKNLMSLVIQSYNVTIDFYWSPLLVESNADDVNKHRNPTRIIRADGFDTHAINYLNADILVFNAYLWWTLHLSDGMKVLYGSFEDPNAPTKDIEMSEGYDLVLKAWSQWLEKHMQNTTKPIFFMTLSPAHYWAEEWGGRKNNTCYNETEPIHKHGYRGKRSEYYLMRKLEEAVANLKTRGVNVQIVNISQLSEYRKDAHPSIYRKFYPTPYHDCTHWCLPGVPDVWNEMLSAYIIAQNNTQLMDISQNNNSQNNTPIADISQTNAFSTDISQNNAPLADISQNNTQSTNIMQNNTTSIELKENKVENISLRNESEEKSECDWSTGRWVYDNVSRPLYTGSMCKFIHEEVACEKYGRKDLMYQNWRWQPHSCDLPRFDGIRLLEKLKGKRLVFIGDSLNRNQWAAMACLIESVLREEHKKRVYKSNIMSLIAKTYNATVDFYWSPLLVESNGDDPSEGYKPDRIMRAYGMEKHGKNYKDADILVFNAHIWWQFHPILRVLYGSFEDANATTKDVPAFEAFEIALNSWSHWLENSLKNSNKQVFFMTFSRNHNWAKDWGGDENRTCSGETEPIYNEAFTSEKYEWDNKMKRKVEEVVANLETKGVKVQIVDISQLSDYRKDAHPSIYRKFYPTPYDDCTHFCVPGVPDVWNELLYAYIK